MHPHVQDLFTKRRLTLIAGPCVIESWELCRDLARTLKTCCEKRHVSYIFKASFDKANRTSATSFRGHGLDTGLDILKHVRRSIGVPVLTDIHSPEQASRVAEVVDVLQIPAFLCRQTDLLAAAAHTGRPTNIKKGPFLAPEDMRHVVHKFKAHHGGPVAITERGTTFGYHNLVVDMRSLDIMRHTSSVPVIFDATHSVQRPGAGDGISLGNRYFASVLARAAAAVGIEGLFCEVHFTPEKALSDGPNSLDIPLLEQTLDEVCAIHTALQPTLHSAHSALHAASLPSSPSVTQPSA